MTPTIMRTEMDAVVRETERQSFLRQDHVTVAVNEGNTNYDLFLSDNYPEWSRAHYADTPACLEAVAAGEADCIIISNYRISDIAKKCRELHLTTVSTGVELDYCFAVRQGDRILYSILTRTTGMVPATTVSAALTYYSMAGMDTGAAETARDKLGIIMSAAAGVLLVALLAVLCGYLKERKANRRKQETEPRTDNQ